MALKVWGAGSTSGSDNQWDTATNWTGDTLPTTNDDVLFDSTTANNMIGGPSVDVALDSFVVDATFAGAVSATGGAIITVNNEISNFSSTAIAIAIILDGVSVINNCTSGSDTWALYGNSTIQAGTYILGNVSGVAPLIILPQADYVIDFLGTSIIEGSLEWNGVFRLDFTCSTGDLTLDNLSLYTQSAISNKLAFQGSSGTFIFWDNPASIYSDSINAGADPAIEFINIIELEIKNTNYTFMTMGFYFGANATVLIDNCSSFGKTKDGTPFNPARAIEFNCSTNDVIVDVVNGSNFYAVGDVNAIVVYTPSAVYEVLGVYFTNMTANCRVNIKDTSKLFGGFRNASGFKRYVQELGSLGGFPKTQLFDTSKFIGVLENTVTASNFTLLDKSKTLGILYLPIGTSSEIVYEQFSDVVWKNVNKSSF